MKRTNKQHLLPRFSTLILLVIGLLCYTQLGILMKNNNSDEAPYRYRNSENDGNNDDKYEIAINQPKYMEAEVAQSKQEKTNSDSKLQIQDELLPKVVADEEATYIYMHWPYIYDNFSLYSFKALESILSNHPNAKIRILYLLPNTSKHYRMGTSLGWTYFQKYMKRGYDIDFLILDEINNDFKNYHETIPGGEWFYSKFKIFYKNYKSGNARSSIPQDKLLMSYLRLYYVYKTGGAYIDFTTFLYKPIPKNFRGYSFGVNCDESQISATNEDMKEHLMLNYNKNDKVLECALDKFDSDAKFISCLNKSSSDNSGVNPNNCIEIALLNCSRKDASDDSHIEKGVEWFTCKEEKIYANNKLETLVLTEDLSAKENNFAFSLGKPAKNHVWNIPHPDSLVKLFFDRISLNKWHPLQINPSCKLSCPRFSNSVDDDPMAHHICAPSFVVPGFPKAATSTIFLVLSQHPQVLRPLTGANFKEPGFYLDEVPLVRNHFPDRVHGYPYIEKNENFITADGTVYYFRETGAQNRLHGDNPNMKAVVMLRDPFKRSFSQFYFEGTRRGSINEKIEANTDILEKCYKIIADIDMKNFQGNALELSSEILDCFGDLWFNQYIEGAYLPSIMHWHGLFGKENLLLLEFERFHLDFQNTMTNVTNFLGLCPYDEFVDTKENQRQHLAGKEDETTEENLVRLKNTFDKWNQKLYDYLDHDYQWKPK